MKNLKMRIVKTDGNGNHIDTTHISDINDKTYLKGWGIPVHAKNIISDSIDNVKIVEIGDTVMCEIHVGSTENSDGIRTGGHWESKIGIVEKFLDDLTAFVRFNDKILLAVNAVVGSDGYPTKNIQFVSNQI